MTVDERLAGQAREAAQRITGRQHDLDAARADFQRSVRALYLDGGSLREIADVLGLSHQRVHQLLDLPVQRKRRGRKSQLTCAFCARERTAVRKLIMGPGVGICNDCVPLATVVTEHRAPAADSRTTLVHRDAGTCSFCGKGADAGPGLAGAEDATVCTECLALCREILAGEDLTPP
jgi:ClpX C4-type zinc finger